jgi:hypothetical protein
VLAVLDGLVEVEAPDVGDPVQDLLQPCMYINFLSRYSIFRFRALVLMDFWSKFWSILLEIFYAIPTCFPCFLGED